MEGKRNELQGETAVNDYQGCRKDLNREGLKTPAHWLFVCTSFQGLGQTAVL